jgi:NADPH2:quinone reductase
VQAVVVSEFGGPGQLCLTEAADPVPADGQVRVAVHAAGVNPVDAGNRADGSWAGLTVPFIPGYDIAGVVESVGPGVSGLTVGDRVMAMTHAGGGRRRAPHNRGSASWREDRPHGDGLGRLPALRSHLFDMP